MDLALDSGEVLKNHKDSGNMMCTENPQLPMLSDVVQLAKIVSPHFS